MNAAKPIARIGLRKGVRVTPYGAIAIELAGPALARLFGKSGDEAMGELDSSLAQPDAGCTRELVKAVIALSEQARIAAEPGEMSDADFDRILDAIEELREDAERLIGMGIRFE